jgi:glycosyltransferase involved in cell wall biosynthesis
VEETAICNTVDDEIPFPDGKRVLIVVNDASFFLSHRLGIAQKASSCGLSVAIATPPGDGVSGIKQHGFRYYPLPLSRRGRNPFAELWSLLHLFFLFRRARPDLVHLVTIKPVLYGGIAARMARVPAVVSAISGLGYLFTERNGFRKRIGLGAAKVMYASALRHKNQAVIVQNSDDLRELSSFVNLESRRVITVPGSGVDLAIFSRSPEPCGTIVVTLATRLLWDKGVGEFISAARSLKEEGIEATFQLAGDIDPGNPSSISKEQVLQWEKEGVVSYLGFRTDIASVIAHSNIVVLPSYREGMPKILLEAAAIGRAIVTTDVPGCRDAIVPDVTGILVPKGSSGNLAAAIRYLVENEHLRKGMGRRGRQLAERKFDIETVLRSHLLIYSELLSL